MLPAMSILVLDFRLAGPRGAGCLSVAVEVAGQQPDPLGDLLFHRLLADAQPGRHLLLRQFLDPPQPDHLAAARRQPVERSEEHTSELQSLMRIPYAGLR